MEALSPLYGQHIRDIDDLFPRAFTPAELRQAFSVLDETAHGFGLILEAATFAEVDEYYNPGTEEVDPDFILEAIVIDKYSRTEKRMAAVVRTLNQHLADSEITALAPIVGKPKKAGAYAYVTVQLPFSDGQVVSVIFHAPEGDRQKIGQSDKIVAFRWLLNKRDITQVVAPEDGAEVSLATIGKRITQLVVKNSARFERVQKEAQAEVAELKRVQEELKDTQERQDTLLNTAGELEGKIGDSQKELNELLAQVEKQKRINRELEARLEALRKARRDATGKDAGNNSAVDPANLGIDTAQIEEIDREIRPGIESELNGIADPRAREAKKEVTRTVSPDEVAPRAIAPLTETHLEVPGRTEALDASYEILEMEDVQASHLPEQNFIRNPAYGLENERQYHRERNSQDKVLNNSANLKPGFVLRDSVDANQGAPVVDQDNNVLGGNGRAMSIRHAYYAGGHQAEGYRAELVRRAEELGIPAERVKAMKYPMLVRRIKGDFSREERQQLISQLNDSFTDSKNSRMDGKSRGDRLTAGTLKALAQGLAQADSLREYFDMTESREVVQRLIDDGLIMYTERNALVGPDGLLNPDGKRRVEEALRGRMARSYEDLGAIPGDIIGKLDAIAPSVIGAEQAGGDWSITEHVRDAVALMAEFKRSRFSSKNKFRTFLKTLDLLHDNKTPLERYSKIAVHLFIMLLEMKKTEIAKRFLRFANASVSFSVDSNALPGVRMTGMQAAREILNIDLAEPDIFGPAYAQFRGKPDEAVAHLLQEKTGYVPAAFYREGLGNIDLPWGNGGENGFGLAHIVERGNGQGLDGAALAKRLPEIIATGRAEADKEDPKKMQIISDKEKAIVKLTWNDQRKSWLVTALSPLNQETGGVSPAPAFVNDLNDIVAGKYDEDSRTVLELLEKAINEADESGTFQDYESLLDEASNHLTDLLVKEAAQCLA